MFGGNSNALNQDKAVHRRSGAQNPCLKCLDKHNVLLVSKFRLPTKAEWE
ncbi:MAG: hypothetical protein ABI045_06085 [Flavobacteriales bacterium]